MGMFAKATKEAGKLRMAINGPSGSGKTYTSLSIAKGIGGRIALADTESGSARKYSDKFDFDTATIEPPYTADKLIAALRGAQADGYSVFILDSMTHFWKGSGGILEQVDEAAERAAAKKSGGRADTHSAWKHGDAVYRRIIDAILAADIHVIVTMRAKQLTEKDAATGKVIKLGLGPEMREGAEYEFDIEGMLDMENRLHIGKTRWPDASKRTIAPERAEAFGDGARIWVTEGSAPVARPALTVVPQQAPPEAHPTPPPASAHRQAAPHVASASDAFADEMLLASSLVGLNAIARRVAAAGVSPEARNELAAEYRRAFSRLSAAGPAMREPGEEG